MLREITVHQFTFMSLSAVQMIHFIYFDSIHVVVVVVVIVEVAVIVVVEVVVVVKLTIFIHGSGSQEYSSIKP